MSFDHPLGAARSSRGDGPLARDQRSPAFGATEQPPEQATRWARCGLIVGLLVPLVAGVAMFAHPIAAACTDQTAAQREWIYAIAGWVSAGGICIAAAIAMASRARSGELGVWRPLLAALAVGAIAATLFAEPTPLFVFAIVVVVLAPALIVLAGGWVVKVGFALGWPTPFSAEQLKRVSRMLWLELIVWLPALFVLAALLDNVYHDCS